VAGVDRLEAAVSDLIHSARPPLRPGLVAESCDLAMVARDRAAHWSALADDDGRAWTLEVEPDGPARVRLSSRDAEAAVDALIGNVFGHTPEGSGYAVALRCHDGTVELAVDDAGAGIADPDAAQARGVTRAGSTGLGLDIARRSAEAAGGDLVIERSPLGGARVRLLLPTDGAGIAAADPGAP
jgi:signal transduction histidine kinase